MSFENPFDDDDDDVPKPSGNNNDDEEESNPRPMDDDKFSINIKNVNGDASGFDVTKKMKISELVEQYKKANAIKGNAKVILTYQGKILSDKNTIESYDIESDETLHALVRLKGGNI